MSLHLIISSIRLGPYPFLIVLLPDRSHFDVELGVDIVINGHLSCNQPNMNNSVHHVLILLLTFVDQLGASSYRIYLSISDVCSVLVYTLE